MEKISLSEIAFAVNGRLIGPDRFIDGISTDSRTLKPGRNVLWRFKGRKIRPPI